MVRYLIQKPIAVLMCFLALVVCGLVLIKKLPVSLLPNIDVPQIVIHVNYPNTSANVLEQNVLQPIRENFANLGHLKQIESQTSNHTGIIYLTFEYGTRMDLAYIEVNEKLNRLSNTFPRDMPAPQAMRINTSDVPVIRVQVIPSAAGSMAAVSELTVKTLKRRIEQIDGVSLVDINGYQQPVIDIIPDKAALSAIGQTEAIIVEAIRNANQDMGGLSVKDGHYRYFVKLSNTLETATQMEKLPVKLADGAVIALGRITTVQQTEERPAGYHVFNGKEGLVITVQKQTDSKMNELVPRIKTAVEQFKKDYPGIEFYISQDQTFLLDAGISNLYQDIIIGGILTILLLFVFLGNWASPSLMSISIPLSLILTFIFFYIFNISFNIISLSGLALGIGMLIDNSIVVIDNITRKRRTGMDMMESSVQGTNEVMAPVISQVLTTVAVYAPLVLLNGMAGSLVTDQSIALTISLGVSLLVAFILSPLLYRLMLKGSPEKMKEDTIFYKWVSRHYHRMISHILKHRLRYFLITILIMPVGIFIAKQIPVSALPAIEKKESLVLIDWNAPVDAQENLIRIKALQQSIQSTSILTEAEVGIQQFLIQEDNNNIQNASVYYACQSEQKKVTTDNMLRDILKQQYPQALVRIIDAPNAFTRLFSSNTPYLEARFRPEERYLDFDSISTRLENISKKIAVSSEMGAGLITQRNVDVILDYEKMALYGVSRYAIEAVLQQLYGNYTITEIKRFGNVKNVRLHPPSGNEGIMNTVVMANNGISYPLQTFVHMNYGEQPKFITGDRAGTYYSMVFRGKIKHIDALQQQIRQLAAGSNLNVSFSGSYFEDQDQLKQLWTILFIVVLMLYIILAVQYEDLVQPFIVMLTIPLGISGSMLLLWITGGTLDVMACVGFIVILGLIVDDPTLKVEVLNRLEKEYKEKGYVKDDRLLERMIHEAGDICLKPLLMVSLTTSIAMVPVLFVGGIGNDLQKPLAYVIIGGLTIGTFFTTWFIPLAYWYVSKWKEQWKTYRYRRS